MPAHAADQKPSRLAMAPGAAGAQHNPVKDRGFVREKQPALKKLPEQFHPSNPPGQHPDLHSHPHTQPAMRAPSALGAGSLPPILPPPHLAHPHLEMVLRKNPARLHPRLRRPGTPGGQTGNRLPLAQHFLPSKRKPSAGPTPQARKCNQPQFTQFTQFTQFARLPRWALPGRHCVNRGSHRYPCPPQPHTGLAHGCRRDPKNHAENQG